MNDIMLDLETMSNKPTAAIVTIGAVQCNLTTGEIGDTFYRVVDLKHQIKDGFDINADTLYWWLQQSEFARQSLCDPKKEYYVETVAMFMRWLHYLGPAPENMRLWGNGASFDNAIIRHMFAKLGKELPIPFWQDRDVRTVVGFYPRTLFTKWKSENRRTGAHNSLDDCKYQIEYISHIMKELGVKELY